MIHRKRAVDAKKLRKYAVILLLALLVVALSGCVEEGDKGSSVVEDLGEPIDEVTNYVGTEGFGIEGDVQEKLEGEGSLYALVKEETGEESSGPEIQHLAKFAELTYLDENGNEIEKYQINGKSVDLSGDEVEQLKTHSVEKDLIIPLLKDLGGGKYDRSLLRDSTIGEDYVYDYSIFPEGKPTKGNDEIIGNNGKKPEIFLGRSGGKDIVIFNQALVDTTNVGYYNRPTIEEGTKIEDIIWDNEHVLKVAEHPEWGIGCLELAPGLYYGIGDTHGEDKILGTSDKKTCVCLKKP